MRIERHAAVVDDDLPGIYARIAGDNPVAAERVLDAVEAAFARLAVLLRAESTTRHGIPK